MKLEQLFGLRLLTLALSQNVLFGLLRMGSLQGIIPGML